ncbi:glycoside hydrolase family 13 protein [Deinococcus sp.]|uniref:glycoside hydrolase family 13 protein n=1 Tax=Deinococcus sp. TaxID=47478 RepID=UPI003CC6C22C
MDIRTPDWVKDAVFYQIFPDRFAQSARVSKADLQLQPWGDAPTFHKYQGGDLLGVVERLDHIAALGVNAIYFCPVFQSASNHRYHTHDYGVVDPMLGGNQALRELIDAAHARGIRVVLDGVFNHASRGFFQFNDLLEQGQDSAYLHWFHAGPFPLVAYDDARPANYAAWWGNRALPKFNTGTQAVREFLWNVAEHWMRFGIDGWRLDVPNEIDDDDFWREFRRRVKAINPDAYIVGEIWGDAQRWLAGDQFDAVMNYPFTRPCIAYFGAASIDNRMNEASGTGHVEAIGTAAFAARMLEVSSMYAPEIVQAQLNLLDSHDTARYISVVGGDHSAHRLALTFQLTYLGAPCLYYGDEIGLLGGPDPDCRRAFPWDDQSGWQQGTMSLIAKLTAARHGSTALRRGSFGVLYAQHDLLICSRISGSEAAYVLMNTAQEVQSAQLSGLKPGAYRDVLSGQTLTVPETPKLDIPARGAAVLVQV